MDGAEHRTSGVFNAASAVLPLAEHLATARAVAGHQGPLQLVSPQWLADEGVQEWAGERSLPLWLNTPGWEGFGARDTSAARAAGLRIRPLADTLADTLAWELQEGPDRPRRAGLSSSDERALVDAARASAGR